MFLKLFQKGLKSKVLGVHFSESFHGFIDLFAVFIFVSSCNEIYDKFCISEIFIEELKFKIIQFAVAQRFIYLYIPATWLILFLFARNLSQGVCFCQLLTVIPQQVPFNISFSKSTVETLQKSERYVQS